MIELKKFFNVFNKEKWEKILKTQINREKNLTYCHIIKIWSKIVQHTSDNKKAAQFNRKINDY